MAASITGRKKGVRCAHKHPHREGECGELLMEVRDGVLGIACQRGNGEHFTPLNVLLREAGQMRGLSQKKRSVLVQKQSQDQLQKKLARKQTQRINLVSKLNGVDCEIKELERQLAPPPRAIDEIMLALPAAFLPEKAGHVNTVIHFHFSGSEASVWTMTIAHGRCEVVQDLVGRAHLTIKSPSDVWVKILRREIDASVAFMSGRFVFTGDMNILMQWGSWFKSS